LIEWKGLPEFESSWEKVDSIKNQFPFFPLKDKVRLAGGEIVRPMCTWTYRRRRGKSGPDKQGPVKSDLAPRTDRSFTNSVMPNYIGEEGGDAGEA